MCNCALSISFNNAVTLGKMLLKLWQRWVLCSMYLQCKMSTLAEFCMWQWWHSMDAEVNAVDLWPDLRSEPHLGPSNNGAISFQHTEGWLQKAIAVGRCDSAQPWVLLLPPATVQGFIERASDVQLTVSFPCLMLSISQSFLNRIPANLYPNFHMKEGRGGI